MLSRINRLGLLILVVLALLAQAALSVRAVRVEQQEIRERAERRREAALDLALWRLDAALAPLIAAESARPSEQFSSVYEAPGATDRDGAIPILDEAGEPVRVFVPSPLLRRTSPFLKLHFQWTAGTFRSPQVPRNAILRSALARGWIDDKSLDQANLSLSNLEANLKGETLQNFLAAPRRSLLATPRSRDLTELFNSLQIASRRGIQPVPGARNDRPQVFVPYLHPGSLDPDRPDGQFELFLLRLAPPIDSSGPRTIQGIWIDWDTLHPWLLSQLKEHLPEGTRLLPADDSKDQLRHRLASLHVLRLEAPPLPSSEFFTITPVHGALALAWVMLTAALVSMALALRAAWQLSDRRGRFVAGVTHELRTPLTTFCLYSEMLADGVIHEEQAKQEYLVALRTQSQRLRRVVENVLAYSGLEESKSNTKPAAVGLTDLAERVLPVLRVRATEAGLKFLEPNLAELPATCELQVDVQAVEQVLFNLIDNAAKYCEHGTAVEVQVAVSNGAVAFIVQDEGPGLPEDVRERAFKAFERGAAHAAGEIGGLGLGLHLAHELSKLAGGHLHHEVPAAGGCRFVLELPRHGATSD